MKLVLSLALMAGRDDAAVRVHVCFTPSSSFSFSSFSFSSFSFLFPPFLLFPALLFPFPFSFSFYVTSSFCSFCLIGRVYVNRSLLTYLFFLIFLCHLGLACASFLVFLACFSL